MALLSPGVQLTITDESQYLPSAVGSVPFILIATEQNKTINAVTAPGTTKANANRIYGINSQRELSTLFGTPKFRRSSSDTPLHGDELNEYGLMAAYSALGLGNRVWVVRADIDLAELVGTSVRPKGSVPNNTLWLDTGSTTWGIFEFNNAIPATQTPFTNRLPHVLNTLDTVDTNFVPLNTLGDVGDYAVVTSIENNPIYFKHQAHASGVSSGWVALGSEEWKSNISVLTGNKNTDSAGLATDPIKATANVVINGESLELLTTIESMEEFVSVLNTKLLAAGIFGYEGVRGSLSNTDRVQFFVGANAKSDGVTVDSKMTITDGNTSPLSRFIDFGLPPGTPNDITFAHTGNLGAYGTTWSWNTVTSKWHLPTATFERAVVTHAPYTSAPLWRREMATRKPNGSVWMKTSAEGTGTNIVFKKYNSLSNSFGALSALVFSNAYTAINGLDRLGGGLNIAQGSVFAMSVPLNDGKVGFKLYQQRTAGQTKVTGAATAPVFVATEQFRLRASQSGGSVSDNIITIPTIGSGDLAHQKAFVQAILGANIPNVSAVIESTGQISILHRSGGIPVAGSGLCGGAQQALCGRLHHRTLWRSRRRLARPANRDQSWALYGRGDHRARAGLRRAAERPA